MTNTEITHAIRKSFEHKLFERIKDFKHIDPLAFVMSCMNEISLNPDLNKLMIDNNKDLFNACLNAAQVGLSPGSMLDESHFIPHKKKVTVKQKDERGKIIENTIYKDTVRLDFGYKGLMKLARQSGEINCITAHVVYEGDFFEYILGDSERIEHVPTLDEEKRGNKIGVYAIATYSNGALQRSFLTRNDVLKREQESKGSGYVWKKWPDKMWKKTAIRDLCYMLPRSIIALHQAVAISDNTNLEKGSKIIGGIVMADQEDETEEPTKLDKLKAVAEIVTNKEVKND